MPCDDCISFRVWPEATGYWRADIAGQRSGPYNSWSLALHAATADARAFQKASGAQVRVTVEGPDGTTVAGRCICKQFKAA